jgi:hypothetical protein
VNETYSSTSKATSFSIRATNPYLKYKNQAKNVQVRCNGLALLAYFIRVQRRGIARHRKTYGPSKSATADRSISAVYSMTVMGSLFTASLNMLCRNFRTNLNKNNPDTVID